MQYLKYKGNDYILGEIIGEDSFYWHVRRRPTKEDPTQRMVAHPKWSTQVIEEEDICDRFINT